VSFSLNSDAYLELQELVAGRPKRQLPVSVLIYFLGLAY
jgi:hypothetical protein